MSKHFFKALAAGITLALSVPAGHYSGPANP